MKKIAFLNEKGGVSKTTSSISIAACLVKNNATQILTTFLPQPYKTIEPYLCNTSSIKDCLNLIETKYKGKIERIKLDVLCCGKKTLFFNDMYTIKDMLDEIDKDYDYCIIDMPPQFSGIDDQTVKLGYSLPLCALIACDYIVIPAEPSRSSLAGYDTLIDSVQTIRKNGWNLNLKLLGMLLCRVSPQASLDKYIIEENMNNLPDIFNTVIKQSTSIKQAEFFGIPIPYFKQSSGCALDYMFATQEMVKKIKEKERH